MPYYLIFKLFFARKRMHPALYTLFHHCAGNGVRGIHIARKMIIVRTATAAAYKFCETVAALLSRKQTGLSEFFPDLLIENAVEDVAH